MEDVITKAFEQAAADWPSPFVPRKRIEKFTGGAISSKTLANFDSQGLGPPSFKLGRDRVYIKDRLVEWLKSRANLV